MGDEFGGLPREDKVLTGLILPACDRLRRGRSVEHTVELGRLELAGILLEL